MTRIVLLLLLFQCIYCKANAQDLVFSSEKIETQKEFSIFKLELKNVSGIPQGVVMASDFFNAIFSDRDTLVQKKWIVNNDTALFRFEYIANGTNCEFCKAKAIVILPGGIREFYLKVPNLAGNDLMEIRVFPLSDYCYGSFLNEIKQPEWHEGRKPQTVYYLLNK